MGSSVGITARLRKAKAGKRDYAYRKVCSAVNVRDDWTCRACGQTGLTEHHHLRPRSLGRDDSPANLLLLCSGPHGCHAAVTAKTLRIIGTDANGPLEFVRA